MTSLRTWEWQKRSEIRAENRRLVDEMEKAAQPHVAAGDTLSLQKAQTAVAAVAASRQPTSPYSFMRRAGAHAAGILDQQQSTAESAQPQQDSGGGSTPILGGIGSGLRKLQHAGANAIEAVANLPAPSLMPEAQQAGEYGTAHPTLADVVGRRLGIVSSGEKTANELLPGNPGTAVRGALESVPGVGGALATAADVATAPTTLATAGVGGALAESARGIPLVGRVAAGALEVPGSSFLQRVGFQVGATLGAQKASETAAGAIPSSAPDVVKTGVPLVAGLVGGALGGGAATNGYKTFFQRAGESAAPILADAKVAPPVQGGTSALNPTAVLRNAPPGSTLANAANYAQQGKLDLAPGIARSLEQGDYLMNANKPQAVATAFYKIPGAKSVFRNGLNLPNPIVRAYASSDSATAEVTQHLYPTRRNALSVVEAAFGAGASDGGQVNVRFLGGADEAAYPATGTFYDVGQRASMYDLSPEQKAVLRTVQSHNETGRALGVEDYGLNIGRFKPRDPNGIYLANVDASEGAVQIADDLTGTGAGGGLRSSNTKPRFYDSGYDRWAHDQELVKAGKLAPEQAFVPETSLRKLLEASDQQKANAAGDNVFRYGLGGKTKAEVLAVTHPDVAKAIDGMRNRLQGLRSTGARLDARLQQRVEDLRNGTQAPLTPNTSGASPMAAPQEGVAQPGWGFHELVSNLPDRAALKADSDALRAQLTRDAKGNIRSNAANAALAERIGQNSALEELHYAMDRAGGDLAAATDYFDESLKRQGFGMESRQSPSLRARIDRASGQQSRHKPIFNEATGQQNTGQATSGQSDLYTRATGGTEQDFPILKATVAAMDNISQAGQQEVNIFPAIDTFQQSALDEHAIGDLQQAINEHLDVKVGAPAGQGPGRNFGKSRDQIRTETQALASDLATLRKSVANANPRGWTQVGNGIYRYFPADQVKGIEGLLKANEHPFFKAIADINAGVLSGDLSPLIGQQGQLAWLTAPLQTSKAVFGGFMRGAAEGDVLRGFRADKLAEDMRANQQSWDDFAFYSGRAVTPGNIPKEFAGGYVGKIPGIGPRFTAANEAIYTAVVRAEKLMFDDYTAGLVKRGVSPQEAMATAARSVQQVMPTPNAAAAGMNAGSGMSQFMRTAATSSTFIQRPAQAIAEAGEGFVRMVTPGLQPTEGQRLAMYNVTRMAATTATLAASSAAIEAQRNGRDPVEAAINAIDPYKPDKDFLKLTLPGGATVPLGGPYRAIIKAMLPQQVKVAGGDQITVPFGGMAQFIQNRMSPAYRVGLDLTRNSDFYGAKIVTHDFPVNLLQIAEYAGESALPLTAGGIAQGIRKQQDPSQIAASTVGGVLGSNLQLPNASDRLDNAARDMKLGNSFYNLTLAQQGDVLTANPQLRQMLSDERGQRGGKTSEYQAQKDIARTRVNQLNDLLMNGKMTREQWLSEQKKNDEQLRGAARAIFGADKSPPSAADQARDPSMKWLALREQYTDKQTGQVDDAGFQKALAEQMTPDQLKEAYRGFSAGDPKLQQLKAKLSDEYYALPKYRGFTADQANVIDSQWNAVLDKVGANAPSRRQIQAVRELGIDDARVRQALIGRALGRTLTASKDRERWAKQNPAARPLIGIGRGVITPEEQAALSALI